MYLKDFNSKYIYQTDRMKFGFFEVWNIPKLENDGKYYGNSESYCIFLKHNFEEFEEWEYYSCTIDETPHCVLIKNQRIIDCNCKKVMRIYDYKKIYNVSDFKIYSLFTVFSKFLVGEIFKLFKEIR